MLFQYIIIYLVPIFLFVPNNSDFVQGKKDELFQKCYRSELFFGFTMDGKTISDSAWQKFTDDVIAEKFPDGMTMVDGQGKWRNPETGVISAEKSKVVILAHKGKKMEELEYVMEAYKKEFDQYAVLLVQGKVYCNF